MHHVLLIFCCLISSQLAAQTNLREFDIQEMPEQQIPLFIDYPNEAALILYTAIPNLSVESNTGGLVAIRSEASKMTAFLRPERQIITFKAPGFIEKKIALDGLAAKQARFYRVNAKEETYTAEKGTYKVTTLPEGAMLTIDGFPSFKQLTPFELTDYEAKKYRINLIKPDYYPLDTLIEIRQGMKQSGLFTLRSMYGTLSLKAPLPVKVQVNSTTQDAGPELKSFRLPEGTHTLSVTDSRFLPYSETITLSSGQTMIKELPLKSVFGSLVLKSELSVNLNINTTIEEVGPTPKTLFLRVGDYSLSVNDPRVEPWTEKVSITSGEIRTLELPLIKKVGYLQILHAEGFAFSINGENKIKKPGTELVELFEGSYRAEAIRPGYQPIIYSFNIGKRDVVNWEPVFKPVMVSVDLRTEPSGATIQLIREKDTELLGFSPVEVQIPVGSVEFLIKRDGFKDFRLQAKLEEGVSFKKTINLTNPFASEKGVIDTSVREYAIAGGIKYGKLEYNGFTYKTVVIGEQEWTVENLVTARYNDGSTISNVTNNNVWSTTNAGAYCAYENNENNVAIYGHLYNWHAINTGKLAPAGWRVPSDEDWKKLETAVGGSDNAGTKLKAKSNWERDGNGTDDYGFSALPGGFRSNRNGAFLHLGSSGYWWSTTADGTFALRRLMNNKSSYVNRDLNSRRLGFSVRLVRDVN